MAIPFSRHGVQRSPVADSRRVDADSQPSARTASFALPLISKTSASPVSDASALSSGGDLAKLTRPRLAGPTAFTSDSIRRFHRHLDGWEATQLSLHRTRDPLRSYIDADDVPDLYPFLADRDVHINDDTAPQDWEAAVRHAFRSIALSERSISDLPVAAANALILAAANWDTQYSDPRDTLSVFFSGIAKAIRTNGLANYHRTEEMQVQLVRLLVGAIRPQSFQAHVRDRLFAIPRSDHSIATLSTLLKESEVLGRYMGARAATLDALPPHSTPASSAAPVFDGTACDSSPDDTDCTPVDASLIVPLPQSASWPPLRPSMALPYCHYCRENGHFKDACPALAAKASRASVRLLSTVNADSHGSLLVDGSHFSFLVDSGATDCCVSSAVVARLCMLYSVDKRRLVTPIPVHTADTQSEPLLARSFLEVDATAIFHSGTRFDLPALQLLIVDGFPSDILLSSNLWLQRTGHNMIKALESSIISAQSPSVTALSAVPVHFNSVSTPAPIADSSVDILPIFTSPVDAPPSAPASVSASLAAPPLVTVSAPRADRHGSAVRSILDHSLHDGSWYLLIQRDVPWFDTSWQSLLQVYADFPLMVEAYLRPLKDPVLRDRLCAALGLPTRRSRN